MIGFLRRLLKNRRGNVVAIAGAAMPLVIGAGGLALDTVQWTLWKRQLQRAADSAALAGVYDRVNANGATTNTSSVVAHDLTVNLHTWMPVKTGYPQVAFPANSGSATNQVRVTLAVQQRLPFSSMFLSTAPTIIANATAAAVQVGGSACVQALETSASFTGITNNGNTTVDAPDCIMYSNSPSANSASAGGSSSVTAEAIAAVGGIAQSNNWHVGSYRPYSPALPDPFANVTPSPSDMHCTNVNATATTNFAALKAAGYNCVTSLSVGSNKTLNIPADFGPIYINGGSIDLKGTFNCSHCTLVLTNESTATNATIGTITSNAQAENNIVAPTTGPFAGIAIYQDRRAAFGSPHINGGSTTGIVGAMYLPKQELWFNGNSGVGSTCTMLIARRIVFIGTSGIKIKGMDDPACIAAGLPSNTSTVMVRLVA